MRVAQLQSSWRVFELWNTDTGVKPKRGYIRGTPYVPFGTFGQTKVHIFQHITLQTAKHTVFRHFAKAKEKYRQTLKAGVYAVFVAPPARVERTICP